MEEKNYFNELNNINVSDKTEKKNGLTYLSWCWAWGEIKKRYPDANYIIYENTLPNGYVVNYFTDGRTAWVKTGVIINGIEHIEELPVMDYRNQSITLDKITSFNVNTTIQRSLTKAIARHGLGLYIYAGEDLPEDAEEVAKAEKTKKEIKDIVAPKPNSTELKPNSPKKPITEIDKEVITQYVGELDAETYKRFFDKLTLVYGVASIGDLSETQGKQLVEKIRNGK